MRCDRSLIIDLLFQNDPFVLPIKSNYEILKDAESDDRAVKLIVIILDLA